MSLGARDYLFFSKNGAKVQKIVIPYCFFGKKISSNDPIRSLLDVQVLFLWLKP